MGMENQERQQAGFTADFKAYPVPLGSLNIPVWIYQYKSDVSIETSIYKVGA
jgi:hypothetical protein